MSIRDDLIAVRNAVSDGADWLEAMLAVEPVPGGKRFVKMHTVLSDAGPRRTGAHSLTDSLLKFGSKDVVAFFDSVIGKMRPDYDIALPSRPTLHIAEEIGG